MRAKLWAAGPVVLLLAYYFLLYLSIYNAPNFVFFLTGANAETGTHYGFWSGFGGTLIFSAMVLFPPWYYRHTCHDHFSCLRWGEHEAAGGIFKLCWKHHPDMGTRPHHDMIVSLHKRWRDGDDG